MDSSSSSTKVGESSTSPMKSSSAPATPRKRKRSSSPLIKSVHSQKQLRKQKEANSFPFTTPAMLLDTLNQLAVPPNHKGSTVSYYIGALNALRKCLTAPGGLSPDVECRAYTALAELALKVVRAGWTQDKAHPWAKHLEPELEGAIGKGLLVSQNNPTLAVYKLHLTYLQARYSHWQQRDTYSRTLLKRLSNTISPTSIPKTLSDHRAPPWLVYTTHLTIISHALSASPPDYKIAISTLQDVLTISEYLNDAPIRLLTHVLRLRILVDARMWESIGESLLLAESALGLSYTIPTQPQTQPAPTQPKPEEFISFENPFEACMAIHTLFMGVIYYTHIGQARYSTPRLTHLHALLDSGALELFPTGTVDIRLSVGPPLVLRVTHPKVLLLLGYLVSSVAKRDPVGRKPKRKLFAVMGTKKYEQDLNKEVRLNRWADPLDAEDVQERLVKIRADLLSEVVAVCIMRSEFDEAKATLDELIAHTRDFSFFDAYAARITLHHGHLAHALGDAARASKCYAVVAHLAAEGTYVYASARASQLALRIAMGEGERRRLDPAWEEEVVEVVEGCRGMGGTMEAVGRVLQASVAKEIVTAKGHLRAALDLATAAQDNHLRALVLSLVSSLYLVTSEEHARTILETARQLAAGLGASRKSAGKEDQLELDPTQGMMGAGPASLGNIPLGLWIGEQFLEIYKREGNDKLVQRQEAINAQFTAAMQLLTTKRDAICGPPVNVPDNMASSSTA